MHLISDRRKYSSIGRTGHCVVLGVHRVCMCRTLYSLVDWIHPSSHCQEYGRWLCTPVYRSSPVKIPKIESIFSATNFDNTVSLHYYTVHLAVEKVWRKFICLR